MFNRLQRQCLLVRVLFEVLFLFLSVSFLQNASMVEFELLMISVLVLAAAVVIKETRAVVVVVEN